MLLLLAWQHYKVHTVSMHTAFVTVNENIISRSPITQIWHSLERERPKFGHNPARERNEVWVQICGQLMGTNLQAFYKHFYIGCPKT